MANPYASSDAAQDSADRLTRRVTNDIRNRVRRIFPSPELFSQEWFDLSDVYQYVATVAVHEERDIYVNPEFYVNSTLLGTNFAPDKANQAGKAQSTTTIWEREEVCVRLIVEEGKTNLVVRTLEDFYAMTAGGANSALASVPARLYEVAIGCLARCSLTALETLQTLDVRALIDHCSLVLDHRLAQPPSPPTVDGALALLTQQGAVIGYLAHLVNNFEKLRNEDQIWERLIELNIFQKVLQHAELTSPLLLSPKWPETIMTLSKTSDQNNSLASSYAYLLEHDFPTNYVIFFSAFLGSEHYKAAPATFFPAKPEKQRFVSIMEPITRLMMPGATVSSELRKSTRPLTDTILRYK